MTDDFPTTTVKGTGKVSRPSGDQKINDILLEAQSLLTKLKGRTLEYPAFVCTPFQLRRLSQEDYEKASQNWHRANVMGDSSGQAFLANLGFDISKFEQQLTQFKAPVLKGAKTHIERVIRPDITLPKESLSTDDFYKKKWNEKISAILKKEEEKVLHGILLNVI